VDEQKKDLVPRKQSLFDLTADDILDNALQNLDEKQAGEITRKAADEAVKIAIEKRKAQYRSNAAQEEMRDLINNANLLDQRGGDYEIKSTFETATGTTEVQIRKYKTTVVTFIAAAIGLLLLLSILIVLVIK
jgi:hypothetical protein